MLFAGSKPPVGRAAVVFAAADKLDFANSCPAKPRINKSSADRMFTRRRCLVLQGLSSENERDQGVIHRCPRELAGIDRGSLTFG
jgi:hypothetical protein